MEEEDWFMLNEEEEEKLSYAQVAGISSEWGVSGDGMIDRTGRVHKKVISDSKRRREVQHRDPAPIFQRATSEDEWRQRKLSGEARYHRQRIMKSRRRQLDRDGGAVMSVHSLP